MSTAYFSHLFKVIMGISVTDFINRIRISKAIQLLNESEYNITEICFLVGFNNLSHFIKIFKRSVGMTPSEFKKNERK